jgi:AbrB family looped-hinge helix DNA binding protein
VGANGDSTPQQRVNGRSVSQMLPKTRLLVLRCLRPYWGKECYAIVRNGDSAMKKAARITSKGQITVPHEIRRALGVRPGDKLLFEKDRAGIRVRPVRANSPFEKYRGVGSPGIARGKKAVVAWVRKLRGR